MIYVVTKTTKAHGGHEITEIVGASASEHTAQRHVHKKIEGRPPTVYYPKYRVEEVPELVEGEQRR